MVNLPQNKEAFFKAQNLNFDVIPKDKDVLSKTNVKVRDILSGSKQNDIVLNKMSDIFPQSSTNNDGDLG